MSKIETITDLTLERYILGELHQDQMDSIRRALELDTGLRERLEKLIESNNTILKRYPASEIANTISLKLHTKRVRAQEKEEKVPWYYMPFQSPLITSLGLVAIVMSISLLPHQNRAFETSHSETRIKGLKSHLIVFRKIKDAPGVEMLHNLSEANQGDILQLGYVVIDKNYGCILSLDGRGTVTQHFPQTPDSSTLLVKGKDVLLPRAYELDNAPQFERFFFVTSDNPIDIPAVHNSIVTLTQKHRKSLQTDSLDLPQGLQQFSLVIRKVKS
jgi:hypothetical protein